MTCDVCIVGAGIAGLNALFVASRYLPPGGRIVLIDKRTRVGGMWTDTYPYVRLHQPHPFFTVGDIPWALGRERSYLATKNEVLDHFQHCLDAIRRDVHVETYFGASYESHTETDDGVCITCDSDGAMMEVRATRLVKAFGFQIEANEPLAVSSSRVRSVSPDTGDLLDGATGDNSDPIWIIGSGKTAMDTAHTLVTTYPSREVHLVAGTGTFFMNRDACFPTGVDRWWRGTPVNRVAYDCVRRFDGTNEEQTLSWLRDTYGTGVTPEARHHMLGILSEAEARTISAGISSMTMGHLDDVIDHDDDAALVLRDGTTLPTRAGSVIVNCTGYLRPNDRPYEPYMSPSGSVVTIQPQSATFHLTSFAGYYLTHLLMLRSLADVPLYEVDMSELLRVAKPAAPCVVLTLALHNLGLVMDNVPRSVLQDCGLDFDLWYPFPRRMIGVARVLATHRRDRARQQRSLDIVGERFGIRCGPLVG
ncbi:FAD-dependent oxidoreductase [Gordonia sp. CPCC 206044]|uniref:FAD-dependent oxidoreductase n=1 Tax=Gordonia sp. CPCC 206044 TaxID=3140793 RepID=UPI003AF3C739